MLQKTRTQDIPTVLTLYQQAREDLAKANIDQWQTHYPGQPDIVSDIDRGVGYVFMDDGNVVGTCALIWDGDLDYTHIHDGVWLNDQPYLTIHRIVIERSHKKTGVSHRLMDAIVTLAQDNNIQSIRIDTHQDNLTMQGYLIKEGFVYCGIVYVLNQHKRLAFQKIL